MDAQHPPFRLNAPNVITLARFALVPVFMGFLLVRAPWATLVALLIFVLAALSDAADGYLARRRAQVTLFGKFADPLADKLLLTAAWLAFVESGQLGAGVVMALIGREFLVTGLRVLAVSQGVVLAAGPLGKLKTATHTLLVIAVLAAGYWGWSAWFAPLKAALVWLSVLTSAVSGAAYFVRCRRLFGVGS